MIDINRIFITGATGKIGLQFVNNFLKKGFVVIFTSRKQDNIEALYDKFRPYYQEGKLHGIRVDLEAANAQQIIIKFLQDKNIWPDVLINNARNQDYLKSNSEFGPSRFEWVNEFLLDVVVAYELSMGLACCKYSRLRNIVNISSMYGVVPANPSLYENPKIESPIQYGVAKAALIHLTKELAIRLIKNGVRVNSVSYGGVSGSEDEKFREKYARLCPSGKMLQDEEAVGAVDFLASNMSKGMTGHNLVVDGGWTVW